MLGAVCEELGLHRLIARLEDIEHLEPTGALRQHELTDFAMVEGGVVTYPEPQTSLGL